MGSDGGELRWGVTVGSVELFELLMVSMTSEINDVK